MGSSAPYSPQIAICGLGLRLPGGISNTKDYWDLLVQGHDAKNLGGKRRFNPDGFNDSLGGKLSIREQAGYFLEEDIGLFDPSFFSLSRKEAERCDPQQRLLLEVTRECLEDAGELNYRGRPIGCYIGSFGSTWMKLQSVDPQFPVNYLMNGVEDYMLSNRISYEYDLAGPSMTINTACSASLVALSQACSALKDGTIDGAVVGGGCLQLSPVLTEMMAAEGTLSMDGSCKSFDSKANGFARAEGITAIYVKRLDDALRDGNPVRAIIRGCGTNSDGNRAGLMQPQARTQEVLMRQVYAQAGLDPSETAFVECHGTGTAVGDPIETEAVDNMFGSYGIYIGSVKPNIGHCEGSAGLASLIKAILSLEHSIIPPNIKLETPNPKIPVGQRLVVPMVPTPFPPHKKQRISINSFGIGGSNSHVIIDSPSSILSNLDERSPSGVCASLVLFSANTKHSLQRQIEAHTGFANQRPHDVEGMAYTRAFHREYLSLRAYGIYDRRGQVITLSDTLKIPSRNAAARVAMVFSGQGSQWVGMGKELILTDSSFRSDVVFMDEVLQRLPAPPDWSLVKMLTGEIAAAESEYFQRFNSAEYSQPLCTALQIATVNYLRRLEIVPVAVVGHSSGEIAAAYAAGLISLQAAVQAAFYRGFVTKAAINSEGGMAAVGLGPKDISEYLVDGVVVACENSPTSSTISGNRALVERVIDTIKTERPEIFTRMLRVDMAYHSRHMAALGDDYLTLLQSHTPSRDEIFVPRGATFYSSVTGQEINAVEMASPQYWVRNLIQPVRFVSAIRSLHQEMVDQDVVHLEIGPHSTLGGYLRQIHSTSNELKYIATQKRGENCHVAILEAVGHLYQFDVAADLRPLFQATTALSDLPPYPWDHTGPSFWYESRVSKESRFRRYPRHYLLGLKSLDSPDTQPMWRNILDVEELPWLLDHRVSGNAVFPFAGYIAIAGEAIRQVHENTLGSGYRLRHVVASTALILNEAKSVELVTTLRQGKLTDKEKSLWYHFEIQSYNGESWTEHCSGEVTVLASDTYKKGQHLLSLPRRVPSKTFYKALSQNGIHYGSEFALLRGIVASASKQVAQGRVVRLAEDSLAASCSLNPGELDSCLQLVFVAATHGLCRNLDQLHVPKKIEAVDVYGGQQEQDDLIGQATIRNGDLSNCQISGLRPDGTLVFSLRGVHLAPLERQEDMKMAQVDKYGLARLHWRPSFDFVDIAKTLQPPPLIRDHLRLEHQLTFLCMLEQKDRLGEVHPVKPHLLQMRDWIQCEILKALTTSSFPLVDDPNQLAQLDSTARRELISLHIATLMTGPHAPFAEACQRVCDNGPAIFSGEVETIDILTRGDLLTQIYNCNSFDYGELVRLLSNSNPTLRILEVGAGTGGTTDMILRHLRTSDAGDICLPPYSLYTFTDVSAGFLNKAKSRFSEYGSNMEFRVFDASKAPSDQGFEDQKGSYDLIIAANIVHATPYLRDTLSNIRSLLRTGGILLLTELLPTLKTTSYIFGHFSGWWLGESDGRCGGPLVDYERWDQELKASGFSGADTVVYGSEEPYRQIMTIASRAVAIDEVAAVQVKQVTLLCTDIFAPSVAASSVKQCLEQHDWLVKLQDIEHPSALPPAALLVSCIDLESTISESHYFDGRESFEERQRLLSHLIDKKTLWLMPPVQTGSVRDFQAAQFLGLSRSLRSEQNMQLYTLEISKDDVRIQPRLVADVLHKIWSDKIDRHSSLAPDMEFAVKGSEILVPRFQPVNFAAEIEKLNVGAETDPEQPICATLQMKSRGLLNTLHWKQQPGIEQIPDGYIEVEVHAVGLNAFDILSAQGIIREDIPVENLRFGCEAAGRVTRVGSGVLDFRESDRVMFFANGDAMATRSVIPGDLALPIPESMSFDQAATIPVCFGTVLHSLINVARVERDQTVLIHSACGGVGLAAVQICQMLGVKIFLTVGTKRKVKHLVDTYGIPRNHIFSSRDLTFVDGIMRETGGVGVDVVLNSLSGELLHGSWKCVAEFGCMVELGLRDSRGSGRLDMMPFGHNRSYHGVEGIQFARRPAVLRKLCKMFLGFVQDGLLRVIEPMTVFPANEVERAFNFLGDASHIGKAVLTFNSSPSRLDVSPHVKRIKFDPAASYILTGGVGGLGRSIATWMVEHGASHLIFLSRTSGISDTSKSFFAELEEMGCSTAAVAGQVDRKEDVEAAISMSKRPIKGVIHLAMVLQDSSLLDMTWDQWQDAIAPKIQGAWNLHSSLENREQSLDFFFLASSIISILEGTGQANYMAANSATEAFCRYRQDLGLPASVLNICPIDDVGFVAENETAAQNVQSQGLRPAGEHEFLESLELSILESQTASSLAADAVQRPSVLESWTSPSHYIMGIHAGEALDDPKSRVMWRRDRRMGTYHNYRLKTSPEPAGESCGELQTLLKSLTETTAADILKSQATIDLIVSEIGSKVYEYLMMPDEKIDANLVLADMGLDSLLSVELVRWFQRGFGVRMGVLEIVGSRTLGRLARLTAKKLLQKHTKSKVNGHR